MPTSRHLAPALGDLDGDSHLDAIVGLRDVPVWDASGQVQLSTLAFHKAPSRLYVDLRDFGLNPQENREQKRRKVDCFHVF